MKINVSNILTVILAVAVLMSGGLLTKFSFDKFALEDANAQLNEQLMQKDLELGRAHTQFGDAEKEIKKLSEEIQDEISDREATVEMYGELLAKYKVAKQKLKTKKVEVITEEKISFEKCAGEGDLMCFPFDHTRVGYLYSFDFNYNLVPVRELKGKHEDRRIIILSKVLNIPDGRGGWKPHMIMEYSLEMDFKLQVTQTRTPTGAVNNYAELWEVDTEGNKLKQLELQSFEVVVEEPLDREWYWWAPHLDVGGVFGADISPQFQTGGSIGVSFMGWGRTVNDLTLRVARISLDYTDMPGIGITPVLYNVGEPLPLLSNLWIGPHVAYSFGSQWQFGVFLGAVL